MNFLQGFPPISILKSCVTGFDLIHFPQQTLSPINLLHFLINMLVYKKAGKLYLTYSQLNFSCYFSFPDVERRDLWIVTLCGEFGSQTAES